MAALVLLVEDESKLRDLVRAYLERAGFSVLSTGSGAEALTLAAIASPDLVVLDLGLPDVPGETVARELRTAGPVPVVMLTAKTSEEDRIRGLEIGADDYVTKPFSPGRVYSRYELINRVRGYEFEGYERTVDVHVKNLRRKLEEDPASPETIETVLGSGYRLGVARDP